jgi:hypothetical protein
MSQQPLVPTPAVLPRPSLSPSLHFGRIDEDGRAFVRTATGEICVGQWAAGTPQEGLAFFARKFDDLMAEIDLTKQRIIDGHLAPEGARPLLERIAAMVQEPSCIGDFEALAKRSQDLEAVAERIRIQRVAERAEAKAAATKQRESLVAEAENLAESNQWKVTTERYAAIVEEWKHLPRGERATDQALWKRLSAARGNFDRRRRAHFAERDAQRKEAIDAKRALITKAEAYATSTDWAATAKALKGLTEQWRKAPRGSRADEERLWKRFKAAQDAFFTARSAAEQAQEAELAVNIAPKEALIVEAEAILPVTDIKQARKALRDIHRRWDAIGDVPRKDRQALERRLTKVDDAVRAAEQSAWRSSNPEGLARAESVVTAFDAALERMRAEHAACVSAGDQAKADRIAADIEATEALQAAAQRAAVEFS